MKNTIKVLAIIAFVSVIGFTFAACDDGNGGTTHTHSYSAAWSSDATQHWRECTANDGAKSEVANHTGTPCTVCGYTLTATVTGITAVYNGTATQTTQIDGLKADLIVTAQYSDNTSKPVTDYTLSGTLTITGTSVITVTYEGKTTTFTVKAYALFTAVADMTTFLASQADNTATTAYNIRLNDTALSWSSSGVAQTAFSGKFVNLDLSGNTFTSIVTGAFYNCTSLTSITIPASVTSIGSQTFRGCTSLASITIPNSVTTIGIYTFSGCTSLASVTIPNSVTSIGEHAFSGCTSLASITIPAGVTTIGTSAFNGCRSLASVTIPASVTSIDDRVFMYCTSLASVTIPASVTSIGEYAFYSTSLASITIPASVTSIGEHAFQYTSLASITIPEGVTTIGTSAFSGCTSLASVTIREGVTSIGGNAFYYCNSLTSVTFAGTIASTGFDSDAFRGNLRAKFYAEDSANGTPGTYTTTAPVSNSSVWTKQ